MWLPVRVRRRAVGKRQHVISISGDAAGHVRRLLDDAGLSGGGIRISAEEQRDGIACEIQAAEGPAGDDTVVEIAGVRLFLDRAAAGALDDAELVVEDGELALALPQAGGT